MKRKQSWSSLLLFAALLAIAVSPVSALAGKGDRPTDLPGEPPIVPQYEYGDPEPGSGGSPQLQWSDLVLLRHILLDSIRIRIGTYYLTGSNSHWIAREASRRTNKGPRE